MWVRNGDVLGQDDLCYRAVTARACYECANRPGFIEEFNRLTGCYFGPHCSPEDADSQAFMAFVDKFIWSYTVREMEKAIDQAESN
jgi:hypothetical protein